MASPRRSGKRRFLGKKKSSKDVTRRTGIHAQRHLSRRVSLILFYSPIKKLSLSHITNFKNYTGNSSIISDNSGLSGVNAGSHYIFLPKSYENGNFVCFGISLPSFAVKFLARSHCPVHSKAACLTEFRALSTVSHSKVALPREISRVNKFVCPLDFASQTAYFTRLFRKAALPREICMFSFA